MGLFRKKPVVIEAMRYPPLLPADDEMLESMDRFGEWTQANATPGLPCPEYRNGELVIPTLEGDMRAQPGDWIIRGTKGELYPCKPDIFAEIYEPVA